MKGKSSERGMASLSAILVFLVVAGLLIAATVSRNMVLARDLHRGLIEKQADWLVESAIERAMLAIKSSDDPLSVEPQTFNENIAPVYVVSDPLKGEEAALDSARIISVRYSFRIHPADEALVKPGVEKTCIISARCDAPYRKTTVTKTASRLCSYFPSQGWKIQPLVEPL